MPRRWPLSIWAKNSTLSLQAEPIPHLEEKRSHDSFTLTMTIHDQRPKVHIPKLGRVRRHEPVRFVGKVLEGTISRTADRWFLSGTIEMPDPPRARRSRATSPPVKKSWGLKAHGRAMKKLRHLSKQFPMPLRCAPPHEKWSRLSTGLSIRAGFGEEDVEGYRALPWGGRVFCGLTRPRNSLIRSAMGTSPCCEPLAVHAEQNPFLSFLTELMALM